jgi:tetratricopeptide (TPR) repeat protein
MKMNGYKTVLLCFVGFSLLFFTAPAFGDSKELRVLCVDSGNNPLRNVNVTLINLLDKKSRDRQSNAQGIAAFSKLDDSVYHVVARREGFAPASAEFVKIETASDTITLQLQAGENRLLYFENPDVEQKAGMLLNQGLEAFQQNDLSEAESLFRQSLDINPTAADALYYYGIISLAQAKFDQAAEALGKAVNIAGVMKTVPSPAQGAYEQITQNAQQQLNEIPGIRADYALKEQNFDEAIRLFEELTRTNPDRADYHARLSLALTQVNRLDDAMAAVERAIELDAGEEGYRTLKNAIQVTKQTEVLKKAQSLLDEGTKLLNADNPAEAVVKFEEAVTMIPEERQAPLWRQIGRARAALGLTGEAEAAFKRSIELAPEKENYEYRMSFAQFYLDIERFEDAVEIMADQEGAGAKDPEKILLELAESTRHKEPRLSEAALERVIKLNPDNADAHYDLGRLYYIRGKEMDSRSKELLSRYVQIGSDPNKIEDARGLIIVIDRRNR